MVGRIPVMDVSPVVDLGRQSAKATVGEPMPVRASVFREGHDQLSAEVVAIDPSGRSRPPVRMTPEGAEPNRYVAHITPDVEGEWTFEIHSWSDPIATWQHDAGLKIPAGVDVELMFTEARLLLERVSSATGADALDEHAAAVVAGAHAAASDTERPVAARLAALQDPELDAVLLAHPVRELLTVTGPFRFRADRTRALYGSWYEFFPRSEGATRDERTGKVTTGTLRTAAERLDRVAEMGFDVIYLPPIHPIGEVNRKGPNNSLDPGPDDPGSPWAIGSRHGGHDAIHPDLGTFEDFDAFVARARELGLEVALDLALQAAPDHPWVTTHPEFFTTRADGTIAFAENPPKKYQDIYPVNFDNDPAGICREVLRIVKLWMAHGVRVFRVDNPHTKPLAFWEWLLAEVRRTDPDVVFLSEAFTKPAMMHGLGAVGFHQSYTYFTWRTARREIEDYLLELSHRSDHLMRPNFWVNTPDILHAYLQYGGPAAFKVRAALAATGSPSWGVYAGYELFEHVAVKPGSEEYLDSEKYQIRIRDWERHDAEGTTLAPYLTRLNEIRRQHPALQLLRNVTIHSSDDEQVLVFSKSHTLPDGQRDIVISVINLDPHGTRETMVHLDMPALGMDWHDSFIAHDEITGADWSWTAHNYVRLDPGYEPAHVISIRRTP
ncbi:alpha-1,4-glucan--maltose-1-phosphate maltosyltransferase [Nocardioides sp. zg-1228]|uniref:alpha-1,4-glucan--maltose-1-phosphate maltosyltransferase n=1 Tax=Nocardioides sp. zg-1228 TaxID=2763008 RepID=UPI0016428FC9|nr:alpha-1,4-glucan--maltose-1-phosphate maltosyltransferase [Nocardioides sp. zg-1228]MBC2934121.1 alpha-1,4-glucan--maltose-1-phosphate maltosyltransferase [Nocardioides sp. zg-1228]QSF58868.1 alpha-1,4-glucan--maltose-1-phosphate maltosyltransferase [Nocardioides sp. zg-1228]